MSTTMLGERFRALWTSCLPTGAARTGRPVEPIFDYLFSRYTAAGGCHRNWANLVHCLAEFDRTANQMDYPEAVELALWFHDAVYMPGARDNEKRSADLFSQWGADCFSTAFVKKVRALILITRHTQPPREGDESYIVDIDLSSLALNQDDCLLDELYIRKELLHISDAVYYRAQTQFLSELLARPHIYNTYFFHQRYEEAARRNIERLLATENYSQMLYEYH